MRNCRECRRPVREEWQVCGWCGTEQRIKAPRVRLYVAATNAVLALQAIILTGGTIALAVLWAVRGWSVERGQTLGVIWIGVILALGLMAWLSGTLSSSTEKETGVPRTS